MANLALAIRAVLEGDAGIEHGEPILTLDEEIELAERVLDIKKMQPGQEFTVIDKKTGARHTFIKE
jgi:hypothetical protein